MSEKSEKILKCTLDIWLFIDKFLDFSDKKLLSKLIKIERVFNMAVYGVCPLQMIAWICWNKCLKNLKKFSSVLLISDYLLTNF